MTGRHRSPSQKLPRLRRRRRLGNDPNSWLGAAAPDKHPGIVEFNPQSIDGIDVANSKEMSCSSNLSHGLFFEIIGAADFAPFEEKFREPVKESSGLAGIA